MDAVLGLEAQVAQMHTFDIFVVNSPEKLTDCENIQFCNPCLVFSATLSHTNGAAAAKTLQHMTLPSPPTSIDTGWA